MTTVYRCNTYYTLNMVYNYEVTIMKARFSVCLIFLTRSKKLMIIAVDLNSVNP